MLPSIVQAEGYPDVQTFTATYRKAEAVVSRYNREMAEWERQRPALKERPPGAEKRPGTAASVAGRGQTAAVTATKKGR